MDEQNRNLILAMVLSLAVMMVWFVIFPPEPPTPPVEQDLAAEALQGRTVLLVTHDPGEAARLGQAIVVMTQDGITPCRPPHALAPRKVDDLETLETQGALLRLLREDAA